MTDDILAQPRAFEGLAATAPERWEEAMERLGDLGRFGRVVLTGMGSSYFASIAGACALTARGIPAVFELTSSLLYYGRGRLQPDDLVVAVSQSGESVEVVKLLKYLAGTGTTTLGLTNDATSAAAGLTDATLEMRVEPDHGVAIKSYGASVLTLLYLASRLTGEAPDRWAERARAAAAAVREANEAARDWLDLGRGLDGSRAAVITGRGPSLSAAMAGALLFNEVAKVPAWGEDGGEFRHGVIEVAEPGFLAGVVMADGPSRELGAVLAAYLVAAGARVLVVAPRSARAGAEKTGATILTLPDLDERLMPLVQVVPFQWLSVGWAEARGFVPGRFRHTPGVIRSEGREVTGGNHADD
ncbi:MAG TPA: SIS domain-containing protein [Bacillota bacterium]